MRPTYKANTRCYGEDYPGCVRPYHINYYWPHSLTMTSLELKKKKPFTTKSSPKFFIKNNALQNLK